MPKPESIAEVQRLSHIGYSRVHSGSSLIFAIEAEEQHPTDTGRFATVFLASCYSEKTARLVVDALNEFKMLHLNQFLHCGKCGKPVLLSAAILDGTWVYCSQQCQEAH